MATPEDIRDRIKDALDTFGPPYGRKPGETTKKIGHDELIVFLPNQKMRIKVDEIKE